ncbi:MAG: DUF805 domain-containing protein [Gammaproteobacteria bacterium]
MDEVGAPEIQFFALETRIGRLRYLAYSIGVGLLVILPLIIGFLLLLHGSPVLGRALLFIAYVFSVAMSIIIAIRRLHDVDHSGWWCLFMFVPLANLALGLYLIFAPGSFSDNRFGDPPPPNTGWVIAGAWTYPGLIVLGIIIAILTPLFGSHAVTNEITQGMQILPGVESEMLVYYKANDAWPTSSGQIALPSLPPHGQLRSISIENDGSIHIIYERPLQVSGRSLFMTPNIGKDGSINWVCTTNIPHQFLTKQMAAQCWPMVD